MLLRFIKKKGFVGGLLYIIESTTKFRLPLSSKARWKASIPTEIYFWERYLKTGGLQWQEDYSRKLDPNAEVDDDIKELLIDCGGIDILDVGAGPLTVLGKKSNDTKLNIIAVDPLAKYYDELMDKYGVKPVVRTEKLEAENLTSRFLQNTFDLVFAQNCIDHSFSPESAILQMLKVVKPDGYVYMRHGQNEAIKENWQGLHQWNFSEENGHFIISSKQSRLNFSKKYTDLYFTECKIDDAKGWILVKLKKIK